MPAGAIYVGRRRSVFGTGRWSNPFCIGGYFKMGDPIEGYRGAIRMEWSQRAIWKPEDVADALSHGYTLIKTAEQAVEWYRRYVSTWGDRRIAACRAELGGHDLACWCALDQPCHAAVLLEISNS
jgi:hypothetical protein